MGSLELLWKRLDDAKLQMDHCHNYLIEIRADKAAGAIPEADGNLAHAHALRAEEIAVERFLRALSDLRVALAAENVQTQVEQDGHHAITPREREVLALIAAGKSSKQVAAQLGISFRTVVCHRYRLQKKLNAHNTAELVRAAFKMGLVEV